MTLSDLSVKKPVFAWMLMIAFMVLGGIAFLRLGVSQMPDVDYPVVNVALTWEGAAPEIIENDVVDVVEDAVMSVQGIKEVTSSCRQGSANVTIEFNLDRDIDVALQDVQAKLAQAQRLLPKDMDPPVVSKNNPEDSPIMFVGLIGPRPPQALSDFVRNQVKDRLQTVPGVGEISLGGGYLERNVRIWLDTKRIEAFSLSTDEVIAALQREHVEVPAGRIEGPWKEINVRSEGEAPSLEDFRRIILRNDGLAQVRLEDIAVVEDGLEDRRRIARSNGEPSQGIGIRKQRGANAVAVAKGVRAQIEEIRKGLPPDLKLEIVFDSTPYIEASIHEIQLTMILAVFLTAFVCWLFLGSLSSTINIVLAIPTSILGTFAVMYFMGFTLNTFTLLALSLSIGIVVDDAIMVMENIFRHREMGKGRVDAARDGAREITFAAMAATVAIIAIFLPIAFAQGIIGKFLFQFGVVLSVSVFLSLIEALTIAPARCSQFLDVTRRTTRLGRSVDALFEKLAAGYSRALRPAIRWRWAVFTVSLSLFAASLFILTRLPTELVPSQDQGRFLVRLQTPVGSSIDYTDRLCRQVEDVVIQQPEIERYFMAVGGFGGGEVNTANLFVTLKPRNERKRSMQELIEFTRQFNAIPDLKVTPQDLASAAIAGRRGANVEVSIRGPDWDKLAVLADRLMDKMEVHPLLKDVNTDYQVGMPEIHIMPDRKKAAESGVSMAAIGNTVGALIGGTRIGKFKDQGRRYDVRVRVLRDQRLRTEDVRDIRVRSASGELVPLSEVVTIEERPTLLTINRKNRERAIGVQANVPEGKSHADAFKAMEDLWKEVQEEGYQMYWTGTAQTTKETQQSLLLVMALGLFIAYVVLASQFNSFIHPVTVFLALPFSVMGAVIVLWVAGLSLNIYSAIGIILLMGIAKKNSIILVDYTNQNRDKGADWKTAIFTACPIRLRPILMTSMSTIAGAIPAAMSIGAGAELIRPMALSVIGGMVVSTLFTLFVVPSFYGMVEDVKSRLFPKKAPVAELPPHAEADRSVIL
ncbi:MAG TPA: efflux RND transporter permease subunit [Planctomycetota bacterium]|nr:efflux RND transporter permease subunit [Planctomycetota bacterium]